MSKSENFLSAPYTTCSFPDCERQAQKRSGLCTGHRGQQKRGLELQPLPLSRSEIMARFGGLCRLDFCDEEVWIKGYCKYHYAQHQRGKPFKVRPDGAARSKPCEFEGCDRLQHSKGHCSTHAKQRRDGLKLTPLPARRVIRHCSFPDCGLEVRTKGLCVAHYTQSRRGGELQPLRDYFTPERDCSVTWCQSQSDRRGLCKSHRSATKKYNLTDERLVELVQNNTCAICAAPPDLKNLHIDHDHSCCPTGGSCGSCVRGLLCADCNLSLGKMGDSADRLRRAADYLEGRL